MSDTGIITIKRTDEPRADYEFEVILDTNFGDAYILLEEVDSLFPLSDVVFDCEGSTFFAYARDEAIAADLATALKANVRHIGSYGTLVVEVEK